MDNTKKVYIYNPLQTNYYLNNGMRLLNTGIHKRTKKTFWVFGYEDTKEVYLDWINRKH